MKNQLSPLPARASARQALSPLYPVICSGATLTAGLLGICAALGACGAHGAEIAQPPQIQRVLPPVGLDIPADVSQRLNKKLAALRLQFRSLAKHPLAADVEIFFKAVELALEFREFYDPKDYAKADKLLTEAEARMGQLAKGGASWTTQSGLVVRGYYSSIDGSPQPYGMVIPEKLDRSRPPPLFIWLHGRGDKATDLHFINERMTSPGQVAPPYAIVVHPFGRQCVGFKHAGEVDVLEAAAAAEKHYHTDPARRVLIGFSMGGAGAWHLGAHFASRWALVCPGAGFAETARYVKLKPEDYPPDYVQQLWGLYDAPAYVRNLFNTETIAYSGELDKQIQAAQVMEEAFAAHGRTLTHLIGPKTEHKYEPQAKAELLARIEKQLQKPAVEFPEQVFVQTRTTDYGRQNWVAIEGLESHWKESRVDAIRKGDRVELNSANVSRLSLHLLGSAWRIARVKIDGAELAEPAGGAATTQIVLEKQNSGWKWLPEELSRAAGLRKQPGLCGPIDAAFMSRFVVVRPGQPSKNPRLQAWIDFELEHFLSRWKGLMRGAAVVKRDAEVTEEDIRDCNLILWGDPESNALLKRLTGEQFPLRWSAAEIQLGAAKATAADHVPALIYPNPLNPRKYVVVNSGLTFREAHDRTNSQQNPKLPDWALIDMRQPPSAEAPGKIAAAGFFGERWEAR